MQNLGELCFEDGGRKAGFGVDKDDPEVTLTFTPDVGLGSEAPTHEVSLDLEQAEQLHSWLQVVIMQLRRRRGLSDDGKRKTGRTQWDAGPAVIPTGHTFRNGSCVKCGKLLTMVTDGTKCGG